MEQAGAMKLKLNPAVGFFAHLHSKKRLSNFILGCNVNILC